MELCVFYKKEKQKVHQNAFLMKLTQSKRTIINKSITFVCKFFNRLKKILPCKTEEIF